MKIREKSFLVTFSALTFPFHKTLTKFHFGCFDSSNPELFLFPEKTFCLARFTGIWRENIIYDGD